MSEIVERPQLDPITGRFLPGNSGLPGRPKGSRNRLAEVMIEDLFSDWKEHGIQAIRECRETRPSDYLKIVAMIVLKCDAVRDMTDDMYDAAVEAVIEARRQKVILELERTKSDGSPPAL